MKQSQNSYLIFVKKTMRKPSLISSFSNTFNGLWIMIKSERNFQIEIGAFLLNVFFIFLFPLTGIEISIILIICFGVLTAEIFNTAVEKICDFIHPDYHQKIGIIKDIAASGVLLMSIVSIIIGVLIYGKYIIDFLN